MLSIGQISSVINACVIMAHWTTGLASVLVLVALMRNNESSATWSSFSATIQKSVWPTLLGAESTRMKNIRESIAVLVLTTHIGGLLLTLSSIVTPLGLKASSRFGPAVPTDMQYVADTGPFGFAKMDRSLYAETRTCNLNINLPCPGSTWLNGVSGSVNATVPQNITTKFSSASVSTLDMQYRNFVLSTKAQVNDNQLYSQGTWNMLQTVSATNTLAAVEGIVYDTTSYTGFGILNSTIPIQDLPSSWNRDILWLEPNVACVDTNLTLDYAVTTGLQAVNTSLYVTDRGGFINLATTAPNWNQTFNNSNLPFRASNGAYYHNELLMTTLQITKQNMSSLGTSYLLSDSLTALLKSNGGISSNIFGLQRLAYLPSIAKNMVLDFSISDYCAGYTSDYPSTPQYKLVQCMLVIGGANVLGSKSTPIWSNPLFVCAASTQARMQHVKFSAESTKGTDSLPHISVTRQNTNQPILWGIEKTGANISYANPYWGPIADEYENDDSLYTTRAEVLELPAWIDNSFALDSGYYWNTQSSSIPGMAWDVLAGGQVRGYSSLFRNDGNEWITSGAWQYLTTDWFSTPLLVESIWTDLMINNVVGANTFTSAMVQTYYPSASYDLRYAIPGFLLLVIWLPVLIIAIFAIISRRVTVPIAIQAMNQTAIGRAVISMTSPLSASWDNTENWVAKEGHHKIGIIPGTGRIDRNPPNISLQAALFTGACTASAESQEAEIDELEENVIGKEC